MVKEIEALLAELPQQAPIPTVTDGVRLNTINKDLVKTRSAGGTKGGAAEPFPSDLDLWSNIEALRKIASKAQIVFAELRLVILEGAEFLDRYQDLYFKFLEWCPAYHIGRMALARRALSEGSQTADAGLALCSYDQSAWDLYEYYYTSIRAHLAAIAGAVF